MLVAALALSAPVHAQSDSDRAQASQMADEGVESYQRGEWAKALRLFQRAYSLVKAPSFLLYQARCFARLDNFDEADALYQRTIENGDGDKSATAQQAANEARGEQQILRMRRDSSRGVAPKPVTPSPAQGQGGPRAPSRRQGTGCARPRGPRSAWVRSG